MRRATIAWTALAVAALCGRADAHLVSTGLGPFYDGLSHFAVTAEEAIGVVGVALLAGLAGAPCGRSVLLVLPLAWLAGGISGVVAPGASSWPVASGAALVVIGALVAADRPLGAAVPTTLAGLFGVVHGRLDGAAAAAAKGPAAGLAGIAAAVFVVTALAAALAVGARPGWQRTTLRVAGSWIAAIGLLLAAWSIKS